MIRKWKIFRLINYIQLFLCCASVVFYLFLMWHYDPGFTRIKQNLVGFIWLVSLLSVTSAFSIFNLNCLAVNYPGNIYSVRKAHLLTLLIVLGSISTLIYFLIFSYGFYDTFIRGHFNAFDESVTLLSILAFLFTTGIYSLVNSRRLKNEVSSTSYLLEDERINAMGSNAARPA